MERKLIESNLEGVSKIFLILKNQEKGEKMLEILEFIVKINLAKTKIYNFNENLSSNGFLINFFKLVMKIWTESIKDIGSIY